MFRLASYMCILILYVWVIELCQVSAVTFLFSLLFYLEKRNTHLRRCSMRCQSVTTLNALSVSIAGLVNASISRPEPTLCITCDILRELDLWIHLALIVLQCFAYSTKCHDAVPSPVEYVLYNLYFCYFNYCFNCFTRCFRFSYQCIWLNEWPSVLDAELPADIFMISINDLLFSVVLTTLKMDESVSMNRVWIGCSAVGWAHPLVREGGQLVLLLRCSPTSPSCY